MVGTALTDDGRAFQARAAATGKARSPSVERRNPILLLCRLYLLDKFTQPAYSVYHAVDLAA